MFRKSGVEAIDCVLLNAPMCCFPQRGTSDLAKLTEIVWLSFGTELLGRGNCRQSRLRPVPLLRPLVAHVPFAEQRSRRVEFPPTELL